MELTAKQKRIIVVLLAGTLLAVLNLTLLAPALPAIMNDMAVDATTVQWLTSGYALVEAVVIPLNAYLVGRFSTRKLFIVAMAWFALGSAAVGCAPIFGVMLLGRVMQAMATGVAMPMVFTLILLMFPRERRGSAMGIVGLIIGFAPAVGPTLAGLLVDHVGWRVMFYGVAVFALLVAVFAILSLEESGDFERAPFDAPSVALMAFGMVGLLYGLSTFTSSDNLVLVGAMIAAGVALLALFVRRQLRLEAPILRVEVLKTRQFRIMIILVSLMQAAFVGGDVVLPIFVQQVIGQDATTTGLVMLPGAVLGALLGLVAGRLFDTHGVRKIVVPGIIAGTIGAFFLTLFGESTSPWFVCLSFTIMAAFLQFVMTPLETWGVNSLDNVVLQHGNSVYNTVIQVGASFGTALIVSLTGLSGFFAPSGASAFDHLVMGEHIAFIGMFILIALVAVGVIAFVKDSPKASTVPADSVTIGVPGLDRPWVVADVMNSNIQFLEKGATVRQAVALLRESETSGLPIVDEDGAVLGFISDGDVVKFLAKQSALVPSGINLFRVTEDDTFLERFDALMNMQALDIATHNVFTVEADGDPEDTFKVLAERCIKKLPVVRDGKLVGSISRRNIIGVLDDIALQRG